MPLPCGRQSFALGGKRLDLLVRYFQLANKRLVLRVRRLRATRRQRMRGEKDAAGGIDQHEPNSLRCSFHSQKRQRHCSSEQSNAHPSQGGRESLHDPHAEDTEEDCKTISGIFQGQQNKSEGRLEEEIEREISTPSLGDHYFAREQDQPGDQRRARAWSRSTQSEHAERRSG